MRQSDVAHPDYSRWLIDRGIRANTTGELLHALVSRDVRAEMYRRWRAERCNEPVEYTDDLDRLFTEAVVGVLEVLIEGSRLP